MSAKELLLRPVSACDANAIIKRLHYSGKVTANSQFHIGVFWKGRLEGALQFGPSIDNRRMMGIVKGTQWGEFVELNRLAFSAALPRNSESRAIGVAMRLLRKHSPRLKWVVSFADGTQCGDGTIYRASGFVLTSIKKNRTLIEWNGYTVTDKTLNDSLYKGRRLTSYVLNEGGGHHLSGFQLRYIKFLDPSYRTRLTVDEIPYARIKEMGAGMYLGKTRERSAENGTPIHQSEGVV